MPIICWNDKFFNQLAADSSKTIEGLIAIHYSKYNWVFSLQYSNLRSNLSKNAYDCNLKTTN